ncbi:hypothetical protein DTO271D3_5223 [Paecilomyces variotii]|nr:hypothetical protein DTO271D3_5223 [Paecilomyces variotii]
MGAPADVEQWTLLALAIVIIIVRVYVRWTLVGPRNFAADDYLMPVAGIVFIMETVAAYLVGAKFGGLTNSYMTPEERAELDPNSKEYYDRVWGSKIQVIGWSFYVFILWTIKFCLAFFYARLTTGLAYMELRVKIAYVVLGATYIMVCLTLLLSCRPMHKFWQINPDPGNICQATHSQVYVYIAVVPNVLTDLYLLSIPLPMVWKVNISVRKRVSLMALFSGAAFVIMASIIRAVTIVKSGPNGAVAGSQWACRETFVSIIVSNLPIIQPLLRKGAKMIGLTILFSSYASKPTQSYPLSSKEPTSRKRGTHPLSIPKGTAWGSDEHILVQDGPSSHGGEASKEITVVQETVVQSETWSKHHASHSAGRNEWFQNPAENDAYRFSVTGGAQDPHDL